MKHSTLMYKLSVASFALAAAVVVLGAYTRLADAGLGCPDWPTCYGHLWVPTSEADVAKANEAFAETPVEHDKTWPEQLHRIFASTLGLLILILLYVALRNVKDERPWKSITAFLALLVTGTIARIFVGDTLDPVLWVFVGAYFASLYYLHRQYGPSPKPYKLPAVLAGLVILQGLFGMWTVTLKLWPQVVTLHLLGGFATLSLLWVLIQRQSTGRLNLDEAASVRRLAILAIVVVALQIALGGWVSSNYAALACPDFPLCQNSFWPEAKFAQGFNLLQDIGPNYLGGVLESKARIAIHLAHRVGALLVLICVLAFVVVLWRSAVPAARRFAFVLLGVLAFQLTLGIMNIVLSLPLAIAVAHNAGGAVLLLTLITITMRLWPPRTPEALS